MLFNLQLDWNFCYLYLGKISVLLGNQSNNFKIRITKSESKSLPALVLVRSNKPWSSFGGNANKNEQVK